MRLIALAMALALAQSAAPDRSTAASPQTVAVRIDLVATDARGRPVDNLKAADVVVREDGVVQPAAGIRIARPVDDDGRLIGIYLDEYHVSPDLTGRVRDALVQFI